MTLGVLSGLLALSAGAPPRGEVADPMVLALSELRGDSQAPAASVLWFAAALGRTEGSSAVAANHARGAEAADFPWVRVDPGGDPVVLVVLVREAGDDALLVQRMAPLLEQTIATAAQTQLDRGQTVARLKKELLQAAAPPLPAATRLIGISELRFTPGDLATARVGLIVKKQLNFSAEGASYRLQFQLVRAELLAPPPPP